MSKTVRAMIRNSEDKFYLAIHNYKNPDNFGKWSTFGGHVEVEDETLLCALKREFSEEIGENDSKKIEIIRYIESIERKNRTHYFFYCKCNNLELFEIEKSEVLEVKAFGINELENLHKDGLLFFGDEYRMAKNILNDEMKKTPE